MTGVAQRINVANPTTPQADVHESSTLLPALAERHGVRCYRDACGDYNIPGRYGELYLYGAGKLGLQLGGPRANGKPTRAPRTVRRRIREAKMNPRLTVLGAGEDEAMFVMADNLFGWAAELIGAYRPYPQTRASQGTAAGGKNGQ